MKNLSGLLAVLAIFLCASVSYGQTETLVKAINCGGSQVTVGSITYEADVSNSDVSYSTQSAALTHLGYLVSPPLAAPYIKSRYISRNVGTNFNYTFSNLSSVHQYRVILHFVEPYHGVASGTNWGTRVFDVDINGEHQISNYNIMTEAAKPSTNPLDGAKKVAKIDRVVNIVGTELVVRFDNISGKNDAVVHAIELYKIENSIPDTTNPTITTFSATEQGENSIRLDWEMTDNEGVTNRSISYSGGTISGGTVPISNDLGFTTVTGLDENTQYTFTLNVSDTAGNTSTASDSATTDSSSDNYNPDFALRINTGDTHSIAGTFDNKVFIADSYATGGSGSSNDQIGLSQPYESERYGTSMSYNIPIENGQYQVILSFAELHWGASSGGDASGGAGDRVFDVSIEENLELDDLDVYVEAGGAGTILKKKIIVNVDDEELKIDFSSAGGAGHAQVTAIEILGSNQFEQDPGTPNPGTSLWSQSTVNTNDIFYTTGNVGIGTTNPGTQWKLAVNGHIRAKEIKVETGWADYVFFKDYKLPTLEEVAQHIQDNGHLINIPSAKEVEANGIELGEMNKLLLEKIEELTLYMIQQEKRIQFLEQKK